MCFRPAEMDTIEHRCPACGTNNLPEATMCANCFAPMEPLTADNLAPLMAGGAPGPAPAAPGAPMAPKAPGAPAAPSAPSAPAPAAPAAASFGFESSSAVVPEEGEIFEF